MVKYYYAKRGTVPNFIIAGKVREALKKNPKATFKQLQSRSKYNRYKISVKQIREIKDEKVLSKRFTKGDNYYFVIGGLKIYVPYNKQNEKNGSYDLVPEKYNDIKVPFLSKQKALNFFDNMTEIFDDYVNRFEDDIRITIEGKLDAFYLTGRKYRTIATWTPQFFI